MRIKYQQWRARANGRFFYRKACSLVVGLILTNCACAGLPSPFTADYEARYGSFKASAKRSLGITADNHIEMETTMALKLFGKTVSAINEYAVLESESDGEIIRPLSYSFTQSGLGKRRRQIDFNWHDGIAIATVNKKENSIPLAGKVMDNLSSYLEIRRQLEEGNQNIRFSSIEKGLLETLDFRVLGEETINTNGGPLLTIRLEKIRNENSDRHTDIWLAKDWDYLLVKLVQEEPGSRNIRLDLMQATVNNQRIFTPEDNPDGP